jgi:prolipoprotein diacylglyceryltransferase
VSFPYGSPPFQSHFAEGKLDVGSEPGDVPPALVIRWRDDDNELRQSLVPLDDTQDRPELAALARQAHSQPVHPTQVYSTINALLVAGAGVAFLSLRPAPGRVFALMLLMYGPGRFVLETVRTEPAVLAGLSYSMWVSLGVTAVGIVMWFAFGRVREKGQEAPS